MDKISSQITKNDYKILEVAHYDLRIAEKGENRTNVI